ncbi:hypothetical protein [Alicyclobacillus ferrooxydans]|uniref:Uncharacterized protein n=1 Tax=Alicyclobacillus ferrooxydans TaxID=471514 RepID=A0A0P9CRI9_9BACL|nr:hypothetical protein [Alicyclobacillus ferrooxydans]KPV42063.1 hypothetical protein AN477_20080 [Alicyclobacillus ferrooxydans]
MPCIRCAFALNVQVKRLYERKSPRIAENRLVFAVLRAGTHNHVRSTVIPASRKSFGLNSLQFEKRHCSSVLVVLLDQQHPGIARNGENR